MLPTKLYIRALFKKNNAGGRESDVIALAKLLPAMASRLDLPRSLLRGRYIAAVAYMEHTGIPIDTDALAAVRKHWAAIQEHLIAKIDTHYGVYEGRTFKAVWPISRHQMM